MNDKEVTKLLSEVKRIVGIDVLNHIIIAKDGYSSMREKGGLT
jgi:DNA repair protein RadC